MLPQDDVSPGVHLYLCWKARYFPIKWLLPIFLSIRSPVSALRLEHRSELGSPCARDLDFGSHPVAEPHAVKAVTVMDYVFDCMQIHSGMPADLDKRIAA